MAGGAGNGPSSQLAVGRAVFPAAVQPLPAFDDFWIFRFNGKITGLKRLHLFF